MTEDEESKQTPEHLAMMSWMAQGYRSHIDSLKRGARSGISRTFGSAADLLPLDLQEKTPAADMDVVYSQPPEEEVAGRTLYLACLTRSQCREFLDAYLASCRNGELGQEVSQFLGPDISKEAFVAALKELTSVSVYLVLFDLGSPGSLPEWLTDFLGGSLGAIDFLMPEPSIAAIMTAYESVVKSHMYTCKRVSLSVCSTFGLGAAGWSAQAPINDFLLGSVAIRRDYMRKALEEPFEVVESKLKASLT